MRNSQRLAEIRKKREEGKNKVSSSEKKSFSNSERIKEKRLKTTINFDTFQSDLAKTAQTIDSIYSGWQTPETMANTLSSVQSMYDRIGKYQEYQKKYGGADLSELQSSYKNVLDKWEDLSTVYGGFKNAKAFDKAKKDYQLGEQFKGLTYDEVQAEKKKYALDSDEYKFLYNYTGYTDLNDFDKAMKTATPDKLDKLETARNKWKLDHASDMYKHLSENKDFAEKSKYVSTKGDFDNWWDKLNSGQYGMGYGDLTYEFINNADGIREEIKSKANTYSKDKMFPSESMTDKGYEKLNPDEIAYYNYIYNTKGEKEAQKFLDDIEISLQKRVYDENTKTWKENSDGFWGGLLSSAVSIPASVFGSIPTLVDTVSDAVQGKEYNPYSFYKGASNYASDVRENVGENIAEATEGWEIGGMNIPSFLYSTGMSIADNLVGANALGSAYLPLMGTNAFHQKAKELTEAGEDTATIYKVALASGAAEMVFEKFSLDHFLKIKNVDDIGKIITNTLKQAGIEGSEEIATELSNIITDSAIRGKNSELVQMHQDLIKRGYSEKEADIEIAKHIGSQVTWAGIGGALSGASMGSVGNLANYSENASTGRLLQNNEQAEAIFNIASTSDMESAYEAYNEYIGKGATAQNISNARLGNIYHNAKADVSKVLKSKTATDEQRTTALKNALRLAEVDKAVEEGVQKKSEQKEIEKTATKNFNVNKNNDESVITETGKAIGYKNINIAEDKITVATENGDVSIDDATLSLRDAELVEMASRIAKEEGENLANTFLHNYDKKTNLDEYQNSFNLAIAYAKNDFSYNHIFDNKGSLSAEMVSEVYQEVKVKADKEQSQKIAELNQKMADMKFYKGVIDDSAIDYDNTSAEGKVNWNDLTEKQRKAVTFVKGFAQATGMNLVFAANNPNYNGKYDRNSNTIYINLDRGGLDSVTGLQESIIPAMSHETTHWMKNKSPELWTKLNEVVFSTLVEHHNKNAEDSQKITEEDIINKEYLRLVKRNKKNGIAIDKDALIDEAREEIIARACEDILSMSKQGRKLFDSLSVKEQNTLAGKIKELIHSLLDWVDELLHSYKSNSPEAKILREYKDSLNKAVEIWDEMLEQSVTANQSLEKSGAYKHNKSESERHSIKTTSEKDSTGRKLSEGQMEYFKNSTVRDENGNLLVMYRGDSNEFTVFDRKKTNYANLYGRGFYFTNSKAHAEQYGDAREFYLDIKNPLSPKQNAITKKQMLNFLKAIENDGEDYDLYNYGQDATAESVLNSVWGKGDFEMLQDVNASAIGDLVAAVELFNEVNGTSYDGIVLPTETVTFNSEQAKLTSNLNPTKDKDMRFSMKENVEETKDLIAVHNLSAEKLLKSLKLGGLPMPSIAITRAREGYNNFGDISLVFNKNTIDPEFMRSNKVYSGDAWTPTYPQIAYKVNEKVTEKIREKINALVPKNIQNDLGGLHLDSHNLESELNRHGDMVTTYRYNHAMKYAFLKDNNVNIELPTKEEPFYRYGEVSNSAVISFANKLVEGLKTANSLYEQHSSKLMADEELLNSIATVLNEEVMATVEENSEAYQKLVENPLYKPEDIDLSTVLGMLEAARKYFYSNGKIESKIDYRNANSKIDDYFNSHSLEKEYEYWLKKLFSDVVAKEGIRNNKDLFTPSGNRRSFEALHYEHTLENVVKAMKEEGTKGIGGFGGGNIFGASTNEYSSIDEIKADAENRMHYLPESKYEEIKKGFRDRLFELANSLPIHKDSFSALDDATNMLIEAVSKFKTKSGMANYLRTESKGWANYSDYIVDDLVELVNDIRNMPAQYFEAKPQRAVGFNEIEAVIMPLQESYEEDLSEVKAELEKLNVPILEYEYGDNNARIKALNSVENVRFSEKNMDAEYLELAKDPLKNEARLREMVYEVARAKGYTDDSSWRMEHSAPNSKSDVSLDKLKGSGLIPDDFWEHPEWYTYSSEERESYYKVKKAIEMQERRNSEGNPRPAHMWVYRAVDKTKNKREDYFRNGDWVTPSQEYAINEGKMNPNGYRIIKHSVSIKDLYWDGNSIAELGYDDGNNYAYADTLNNRKSLDLVTYDFDGNIIPLSKRFNKREYNVRYSEKDADYMKAVENRDVETASRLVEEAAERAFSNSKVRGSDGKLRLVYHGRVSDFNVFDRQFANIEGDFGKGYYFTSNEYDVDANYANEEGPDLKNKIARLAERLEWDDEYSELSYEEREEIARQSFITSEPNTITAYLNMENPVYITPDESGTFLDHNEEYDEEYDEYGEPEGLLIDFVEALQDISKDYAYNDVDFSFIYDYATDGGVFASDIVKTIKHRIIDELTDDNGDLAVNEVIRLAFEQIGFDGIIDTSVYYKFNNMDGMDSGTTHYIVFNGNQIKSADIATYDDNGNVIPLSERFNTENEDIRYSDKDYIAYDTTAILKESTIDKYLKAYASEGTPNYAQAYITYMSPREFLQLTTKNAESQYYIENESKKLNREEFEDYTQFQPIQLKIDHETGEVITHEGRHRMVALSREDIYDVPVLLFDYSNKTNKENLNDLTLKGQFNEYRIAIVDEAIPFSYANRDLIIEKFGTQSREQKIRERYGINETFRYSEKEDSLYGLMGETDRILKENEKFKTEIERLKERLALERKVTNGNHFNENQLGAVAGHLRKKANNSTMDKVELTKALRDLYSYIAHSPEVASNEVWDKSYAIAKALMDEAKPITIYDSYSAELLREIRNTRISLDETQKKEASYIFDKHWNRYFFGNVIITDKGTPIEVKWQEWHSLYPDVFADDLSDGDKIRELYDIINSLKEASETVDKYSTEELTRELTYEVYNQYWNVSPIRTTADKYDKQIKRLNFEHRQMMNEIRTDYETRLADQKLADDIYYGGKLGEQKSKYEAKLEAKKAQIEKQKGLYKKLRDRKNEEIEIAKQHGKDLMNKYKDNAQRKTYIQRITANALTLNKWLTKNSKDYHIHEAMKGPVVKLLNAIDFSSKRKLEGGMPTEKDISFAEAFSEVKTMLQDADNMVEGLESLYGHDLAESIDMLSKASFRIVGDNNFILNAMSSTELENLDKLIRHIKKVVTELNKFHTIQHTKGAVNLANEFIEYGEKLGNIKKQHGKMAKFFEFKNRTPYYFFKDLGEAGKKLFTAFQDGWDKLAFNSKHVIDFAEKTYTDKEVKEWSRETKEFKIAQKNGETRTFEMSIAQIMALHCVSKQEDAKNHLLSGGMTLKRIDSKGHVITDYENITLTVSDIQTILDSLTDRQREVADKLQEFMNTVCSEWGNEISMARFGIKMFGLPDYFPIKVSEATVPTDNTKDIDNASLFRLLNMSFTKSRNKNAKQSIEIGDVFDIFAQHSSDMAKYNALALPVLDFNKFYSIHGKDFNDNEYGVAKTLKSVFGDEANGYLRRFVRDLNGSQNVSRDVIGNTFFKNAKVASVAANLRVVLLQPTAFHKAGAVMDNKYLLKASAYIKVEPIGMVKRLKKAIANAEKYCGIVQWKALGYYDTDISKGITEKIKHADTWKDKAIEKSLKGAEIADKVTFGTLWVACEFEIRDTRKDLKVGSEEFYNAIAERLRDVIYATQVVDSTMTRSDMMRSADGRDKMLTTFGSEPTIAYNMLLDMVTQFNRDKKLLGAKTARKKNSKKIRKVVTAYIITNAVAAMVESGFDVLRDDDEEEMNVADFMKLYFKNFATDMSIGNKLPYIKELYSLLQGYSSSRIDTQWMQSINYAMKDIQKAVEGEGNITKLAKDTLKAMSYMTGLPAYNVWRDAMAVLDKLGIIEEED